MSNTLADEITQLRLFLRRTLDHTFAGEDVDGGDLQELAVELGLAHFEPFDPSIHKPDEGDGIEEGQPWLVIDPPVAQTDELIHLNRQLAEARSQRDLAQQFQAAIWKVTNPGEPEQCIKALKELGAQEAMDRCAMAFL